MIAYYDNQPSKFEEIGNGSTKYRWDIQEVDAPVIEEETPRKEWKCNEVTIWHPLSKKKVVSAVISETWNQNHELKLVNEYNSVQAGLITGEEATKITTAYNEFLSERKTLKASVEADYDAWEQAELDADTCSPSGGNVQ